MTWFCDLQSKNYESEKNKIKLNRLKHGTVHLKKFLFKNSEVAKVYHQEKEI
jgi:hypothetical protein